MKSNFVETIKKKCERHVKCVKLQSLGFVSNWEDKYEMGDFELKFSDKL